MKNDKAAALLEEWRERLNRTLSGLVPVEDLLDVVAPPHPDGDDPLKRFEDPPDMTRPKRKNRNWAWNKLARGR